MSVNYFLIFRKLNGKYELKACNKKINDVKFPIVKFLVIIQGKMSGWPLSLFVSVLSCLQ